jgi:hypothetical protein
LEHLDSTDDGLTGTGYDGGDLDDLLDELEPQPPDDFDEYDEGIDTEYCCPKCGYEWSGSPM